MAKRNSLSLECLVLKRKPLGETDRIVTIVSQKLGKSVAVAKGVRRLSSSFSASLEPGNLIRAQLIITKSIPLLIQARLIEDASSTKTNLAQIRRLTQVLEIFDKLFVEEELPAITYSLVLSIRKKLLQNRTNLIRSDLQKLLNQLGFATNSSQIDQSMLEYVQEIVERPMQSFKYLQTDALKVFP